MYSIQDCIAPQELLRYLHCCTFLRTPVPSIVFSCWFYYAKAVCLRFLCWSGLLHGGLVHGTAVIKRTIELKKEEFASSFEKHRVPCEQLMYKDSIWAWELSEVVKFEHPRPHKHRQGAQKWMELEYPNTRKQFIPLLRAASACGTPEQVENLIETIPSLKLFGSDNVKYVRLLHKSMGVQEKYHFAEGDFKAMRTATMKAIHADWRVEQIRACLTCVHMSSLRRMMSRLQLKKAGTSEEVVGSLVQHLVAKCRGKIFGNLGQIDLADDGGDGGKETGKDGSAASLENGGKKDIDKERKEKLSKLGMNFFDGAPAS